MDDHLDALAEALSRPENRAALKALLTLYAGRRQAERLLLALSLLDGGCSWSETVRLVAVSTHCSRDTAERALRRLKSVR